MDKKRVLIVGGGASGLMAAIMSARGGAAVTVLEQNERPGKKICATGNGRCNLTNLETPVDAYRGSHPEFVKEALRQFGVQDTIRFFSELGIYTVNKNGWLYPRSAQAQSVVDVLCMEARSLGVKIKTNQQVSGISRSSNPQNNPPRKRDFINEDSLSDDSVSNQVQSDEAAVWKVSTPGWDYECDAVILANGSKASSIAGSDGSGYALAQSVGHHIVKPLPALTALKCKGDAFKSWAGTRVEGEITLCINDIPLKSEEGELQLTEYGISGIPVFQLSRYAIRALEEKCRVSLNVDFLPEFSKEGLEVFLKLREKNCPYKNQRELLIGLFPDKLIKVLTASTDLLTAIKEYPLSVTGGLSFAQAQVCSGGVSTEEVIARTMESKLASGLYIVGELLDVDGACGGYNLQWAWSSGAAAGMHAAVQ